MKTVSTQTLSTTAAGILSQVAAGVFTLPEIAEKLGVKSAVVTGNLASLKKRGLVTYEDSKLALTEAGIEANKPVSESDKVADAVAAAGATTETETEAAAEAAPKKPKNKEIAAGIIKSMAGAPRKDVVAEIMRALDVTSNNAGAYIQNYRKANGQVTPRAPKVETAAGEPVAAVQTAAVESDAEVVETAVEVQTATDESADNTPAAE